MFFPDLRHQPKQTFRSLQKILYFQFLRSLDRKIDLWENNASKMYIQIKKYESDSLFCIYNVR